jgi:O-antigen/teichoic acid export membrane protein
MRKRIAKIKFAIIGLFLPPLWILIVFGQQIVDLIFDHRYHGGGWILRLFALGWVPSIVSGIGQFYIASGNSKILMKLTIVKSILYFIALFLGYRVDGSNGIIIAMALYNFINYFIEAYVQHQYKVWLAGIDISAILITMVVVFIGFKFYPIVLP